MNLTKMSIDEAVRIILESCELINGDCDHCRHPCSDIYDEYVSRISNRDKNKNIWKPEDLLQFIKRFAKLQDALTEQIWKREAGKYKIHHCHLCGHEWPSLNIKPRVCPHCKNDNWELG